jgi:hypothetical protein
MDAQRYRSLSAEHRALLAVAVLLDGREAATFLENDATHGDVLKRAALDVASQDPELRMPFVGTMLRAALEELG